MAITFETTAVTFTTNGDTELTAAETITSDDITLDADAMSYEIFVSIDSTVAQTAGDIVEIYWEEKSATLYTTQANYLGTIDVADSNPANKSFGLSTAMGTGRLTFTATMTNTAAVAANLHERSTA